MAYVDAHLHFWDVERHRYDWLDEEPALPHHVALDDYRAATADAPPDGFVFVQAGTDPADGASEARWVDSMCRAEPDFLGMVVWAPIDDGADAVRRHLDDLALDSVVGVRRLIQSEPLGLATEPDFTAAVVALGARDLVFDVCIFPRQFADVAALARAADGTRLVLDHFGKPDIAAGGMRTWRAGFETMAGFEHVTCKLSGLVTEADHDRWRVDDLRPYLDVALDCFGPDRLIWGSDWPVVGNAATHGEWRAATDELLAPLTDTERDKIMRTNARTTYRRPRGPT